MLTTAGIAIALKDDFAYVSAIVGSIGSSTLGFILPCIFHLVLCKDSSTTLTKVKDCLFIAFGIIGGVIGVTVTIQQRVELLYYCKINNKRFHMHVKIISL